VKRRLFKLALFLLLGAVVNVAVAWGCAYWIKLDHAKDTTTWGIDFHDGNDWLLHTTQSSGAMMITSDWRNWKPLKGRFGVDHFNTATSQNNMHFTFINPLMSVNKKIQRFSQPTIGRVWLFGLATSLFRSLIPFHITFRENGLSSQDFTFPVSKTQ